MKKIKKRILAAFVGACMLTAVLPKTDIFAANVQETDGIQLQTILIDNDGNDWTTESWGGATMTPNTNWTTLDIQDYYENGELSFEVKNNGSGTVKFRLGLVSRNHAVETRIYWTDLEQYKDLSAGTQWTSYSLPFKELVDANADTDFMLKQLSFVVSGGVPTGTTLSFRNMKISSSDDERQYPVIKVNQVGYLSNGSKSATISYFEKFGSLNGKKWELVNSDTDKVVFSGTLENGIFEEEFSGEIVHKISFDDITETGTYYIRVPDANLDMSARSPRDVADGLELDTLRSVNFSIGTDVYDDMLSDLTKYYYYQRQGIEIEEKYAGVFARENLHPNDITVKRWSDRNNPDAETFDVSGGWYDAGDYGKYTSPGAESVEDLLLAYELYPDIFNNISMNIPETAPNHELYVDAPGILAEVKWELDMLMKLEHNSRDGSFYTAANYKDGVIYLEDTLYSSCDHNSDSSKTDLRCHLATADMAGTLAYAYIIYKDFPVYEDFAEQCLETAQRSWKWVTDSENTKNMSIGAANRTYTFSQEELERGMFSAAGKLYRAIKLAGKDTSEYEEYLISNRNTESVLRCFDNSMVSYNHSARSFLGFFHYLYENENADIHMIETFSKYENWRTRYMKNDTWGLSLPIWGFWWGSNKCAAQSAMTFVLGDIALYGEIQEDTVNRLGKHFDYLLGNNPISFSYVSGHGENSVQNIFSAIYSKDVKLTPYKCPSGYFTEGTNNHNNPNLSKFVGKCYIDSDGEYTTNENTIYGNAAMILLTSAFLDAHKSEFVKGDVNTDGVFNISDVIMLQKWLVKLGDIIDADKCDLDENGKLNVFDLLIMKKNILSK